MLHGETVKIIGSSGEWYQVTYLGRSGWAFGSYLHFGGDSASFAVPVHQQEHSLSCEYASLQIFTAALGREIAEDRFISVVGRAANHHYGFRGNIDATYIFGTDDYGVYPGALAKALPTFNACRYVKKCVSSNARTRKFDDLEREYDLRGVAKRGPSRHTLAYVA